MTTIKLWAIRVIHDSLVNPFKRMLCSILKFAKKKELSNSYIKIIVNVLSAIYPHYKYKFSYVQVIESIKQGSFIGSVETTLATAKPQNYYQQHDLLVYANNYVNAISINNTIVYGSSNIVSVNYHKVIYELRDQDKRAKFKYTDSAILYSNDDFFVIQYKKSNKIIENGILLSGNYSWNYYHFLYEIVSKFYFLDKLNIPNDVPLLVDEVVENIPQFKELLNYLNITNRKIILLKGGYSYSVNKLYFIPLINIIPPNYKNIENIEYTDCQFTIQSIDFLRNELLQRMTSTHSIKRIYLSRSNASGRRGYNEIDVLKVFQRYDFEVVNPAEFTVAEQVSLFNNVEFIAGVTGAAFANILFCQEKCKILCIQSTNSELSIFSTIAKYLALDMQYYCANSSTNKIEDIHDAFTIDPINIENVLIDFLRK